jgi:cysteine desulfurase
VQYANSEIGTIQNVQEIVAIVHSAGALFHTDAVAAAGQVPIDVKKSGIDCLSLSASQFYGPKGAGALFVRRGIRLLPQIEGGIQEMGRRAGLENVPAIVAMGEAARLIKEEMAENNRKIIKLRDKLIAELPKNIEYVYLNGDRVNRLPNNAHFSVEFIEGEAMLLFLDQEGIAISSGSACTSRALKASHVVSAIGVDAALAQGSLNFGLTKYNKEQDIDYVLEKLPPIVKKLREMSPLWASFQKTGKRMIAGPGTDYEHHEPDQE